MPTSAACSSALCCLANAPGGDALAAAADDGRVCLCQAGTGHTLASLSVDVGAIARMTFTPDGRGLVVHGSTRTAVYDLATLGGVVFDMRGVIQLRRAEPSGGVWQKRWEMLPVRVKGIPVGRTFRRLHALLATDQKEAEGRTVGRLVWHYADGEQVEFPIVYGEDVRCWWERPNDPSETKRGQVAWRGSNPARTWEGATLRLYVSTWANARPDAEVKTVDLVSELAGAAPFVIALTVE